MNKVNRLAMIADFLDKKGLPQEASRLDGLIRKAVEEAEEQPIEEVSVEQTDIDVGKELEELKKEKQVFIRLFYSDLVKINQRLQKILDSEEFAYIGKDNIIILKDLYSTLMKIMKKELNNIGVEETYQVAGLKRLALDKKKVLQDVKQVFLPTIKMYEEFEEWLVDRSDFASKLTQTQKTFQNLKNVMSNIVENVSEAITGTELVT